MKMINGKLKITANNKILITEDFSKSFDILFENKLSIHFDFENGKLIILNDYVYVNEFDIFTRSFSSSFRYVYDGEYKYADVDFEKRELNSERPIPQGDMFLITSNQGIYTSELIGIFTSLEKTKEIVIERTKDKNFKHIEHFRHWVYSNYDYGSYAIRKCPLDKVN